MRLSSIRFNKKGLSARHWRMFMSTICNGSSMRSMHQFISHVDGSRLRQLYVVVDGDRPLSFRCISSAKEPSTSTNVPRSALPLRRHLSDGQRSTSLHLFSCHLHPRGATSNGYLCIGWTHLQVEMCHQTATVFETVRNRFDLSGCLHR